MEIRVDLPEQVQKRHGSPVHGLGFVHQQRSASHAQKGEVGKTEGKDKEVGST